MAAESGKLFVLKSGTSAAGTAIANCRARSFSVSGETVDISNADSSGFNELLSGGGQRQVTISCEGVFTDDAQQIELLTRSLDNTANAYGIIWNTGDAIDVSFVVTSFELGVSYNEATSFSATLVSSGSVTYSAAT